MAWLPVTDAERALSGPQVERDAGAEVLEWRVRVVDEQLGNSVDLQRVVYNYVRVKVFDQKGVEKVSNIDLTYREPGGIFAVAGRTIKADGTIVELDRKAVHQRDLIKAGRASQKAVSFALPAVEPGAIVEYRWRQTEDDNAFRYVRLHFQRDLPVEKVTYYVRPLRNQYFKVDTMYMLAFHCKPTPIKPDPKGWEVTSLTNLPAFHSEPYAPSDANLEQWALLYYRSNESSDSKKFWNDEGKKIYHELKESLRISAELKATASEITNGAKNDDEKIDRLSAYLRKNLRALGDSNVTQAEVQEYIAKYPKGRDRTSAEVLKSGLASQKEMNATLAALATAAGLDVRVAKLADRTDIAFNPEEMLDRYFVSSTALAVREGDSWKFVDLSQKLVAPGSLPWYEEGVYALITDSKESTFVTTPIAPPAASVDGHTGHFHLAADGALTGMVEEQYTGHRGEEYRSELHEKSAADQQEWFRDRLSRMFPDSEMSDFKLENVDDPRQPLKVSYRLKAPAFAQVTGKRVLFQPNVFRRAEAARFIASDRKTVIEFPYAWKEVDDIQILLPDGFTMENAENPGGLNLGKLGGYTLTMSYTKNAPFAFNVHRELTFGEGSNLYFIPTDYPQLKKIFDTVHARDIYAISLKAN